MTLSEQSAPETRPQSRVLRALAMLTLGGGVLSAGFSLSTPVLVVPLLSIGIGLLVATALVVMGQLIDLVRQTMRRRVAGDFLANDPGMCFLTDKIGRILKANDNAVARLSPEIGGSLANGLIDILGNPGTTLNRLQIRADAQGGAFEEMTTRRGHLRLAVTALGMGLYAWRIEEIQEVRPRSGAAVHLPMVTAGRSGAILSMNNAARDFVGGRVRNIDEVFAQGPLRSGRIQTVRHGAGTVPCFVIESQGHVGKREIFFAPADVDLPSAHGERSSLDALPVAVLRLDAHGVIIQSNRQAREILRQKSTDGIPLDRLLEGLGRPINDWLNEARRGHDYKKSEFLRLKSSDGDVYLQVSVGWAEAESQGDLIAIMHDATELKNLEAQFVQSQKMQAIGELAGGVAHDFNNLLTAISGHCDLLLLRHDQVDPDFADLVQIAQNANRAAALVGQLLAFSRKQTLRPVVLDLRDTLADLTHLLNRLVGEKISLTLVHDPVARTLRADKRQLEQVLMNLVVNARDAMPDGGDIRIETGNLVLETPLKRDRATVPPGEYVTVRVSDSGVGIPAERLQKIFEPFFTTKRAGEGTGLGLSTAYGIVKQSSGYIFVDSVIGRGTDFLLIFPAFKGDAFEEPIKEVETPAGQNLHRRGEGVILLVEDEAPVRAFASRALKMRGYTVIEAGTGEEALSMLSDPTTQVDLFISDVIMPGMNGPTWVRKARENHPETRVVFVSGYAEDALDDSNGRIESSVFLPKPFSLGQLLETVEEQMT